MGAAPSGSQPLRAKPSMVQLCAECWHRPELLWREVLWRWLFGLPACCLVLFEAFRLVSSASLGQEGSLALNDPMQAAQQLLLIATAIATPVQRTVLWLGPLLAVTWAVASGLGRNAVLRRLDPALRPAAGSLITLQLLRITALAVACLGWYGGLRWAAGTLLAGTDPNVVAYSATVICLSLGMFVLWALVSWVFSVAPLMAMMEGTGVLRSLSRSLFAGPLRARLIEVNLVLGIVRLALLVLAMVFSAIPLPFEAEMTGLPLYLWWAAVTLLYFVASDFFQVVRLTAFVRWRQCLGTRD